MADGSAGDVGGAGARPPRRPSPDPPLRRTEGTDTGPPAATGGPRIELDTAAPTAPPPLSSHGWLEKVEEVTSATFFLGMIVVILVGIFWRYVLDDPLVWTINIATICFIWAVFIGTPLSDWEDNHIQFDLLYNLLPAGAQLATRVFGNVLLIGTFGAIIPATYRYLDSLANRNVVGVGWLSMRWAYSAFLVFLVLTIVQRARLLVADLQSVRARRGGRRP